MLRNGDSSVTERFLEEHRNSIRDGNSWAPFGYAAIPTTTLLQEGVEMSNRIGPKPVFSCIECCDESADIGKLMEHLATEHVEYAPYLCTFDGCSTTRYSRRKLEEHIRAKRHGKITTFLYEEDKEKRCLLLGLLEASCSSGDKTNPLIKVDNDETPPTVEEMPHVPMPSSTPVLPFPEDNDFCDVESAPSVAAEVPLSISRSHYETEKDLSAVTPAEAPKWNKKLNNFEQSAAGKVQMEPMDTRQQCYRNGPNESEMDSNIEVMDMMIDSTGNVVSVTKSPIENSRPPTEIVHKKLNDFDDKINDYSTTKIDLGETKQKRLEKPSSRTVTRRHRRKPCHPAIEAHKDWAGDYVVTVIAGADISPTERISARVATTVERLCRSKRVEQLRIADKRREWTKTMALIVSRAVNMYLRRYTESALPFCKAYKFNKEIKVYPKGTIKQQRMILPQPLSYWFKLALRNDLILNEVEEMTGEESRDMMGQAVYNSKRAVQLSGRELKRTTQQTSSNDELSD